MQGEKPLRIGLIGHGGKHNVPVLINALQEAGFGGAVSNDPGHLATCQPDGVVILTIGAQEERCENEATGPARKALLLIDETGVFPIHSLAHEVLVTRIEQDQETKRRKGQRRHHKVRPWMK